MIEKKKLTKAQLDKAEAAYAEKAWRNRSKINRLAIDALSGKSQPVSIRLETFDLTRAKSLAARHGVGYQTYIKSVLHDALAREARKAERAAR